MEDETKQPKKHVHVETYTGDMAEVIEGDKEGLIKKIIHEEEKHEAEKRNLSPESKKNKIYMFLSMIFVLLAIVILFASLLRKEAAVVPIEMQATPLVFHDKSFFIEVKGLTKEEIASSIQSEMYTTELKVGGVEGIYLTESKKIIGLRRTLALLKTSFAPGEEALVSDNFLFGVANNQVQPTSSAGRDFFILLKVRSMIDAFQPMRSWEAKMLSDLHSLFGIEKNSSTTPLFTKSFEEGIIENKNARILYGADRKIVLMYVFLDDNSVLITDSTLAVQEVLARLLSSQIKK